MGGVYFSCGSVHTNGHSGAENVIRHNKEKVTRKFLGWMETQQGARREQQQQRKRTTPPCPSYFRTLSLRFVCVYLIFVTLLRSVVARKQKKERQRPRSRSRSRRVFPKQPQSIEEEEEEGKKRRPRTRQSPYQRKRRRKRRKRGLKGNLLLLLLLPWRRRGILRGGLYITKQRKQR